MTPGSSTLVSIIIPTCNYGHYLGETLDLLSGQSYSNWECIVVDDGSADNTGHIVRAKVLKDGRFRYVYQQNSGLSAARNTGLENSLGAYLQFLDADDRIHHQKLEKQALFLDGHPEWDIVYGDAHYFHTDNPGNQTPGRTEKDRHIASRRISGKGAALVKSFCVDNFIPVSAPLVRRTVIERTGEFSISYRSYEDWHYWFRCAIHGFSFKYLPDPGTETYIRHGHQSMMTDELKLVKYGIMLRKYMARFLPLELKAYNSYRLMKLYLKQLSLNGSNKT
jgi:glycosyltransferase involved in cell wall biosynthesis